MSYVPLPVDTTSGAVIILPFMHHEVHEGDSFRYYDSVTLGSAGTQVYLITTPNTTDWAHFTWTVDGSGITTVDLYEATDRSGTTLQNVYNANRNSLTVNGTTVHKGVSGGTTDGTKIYTYSGGTSSGSKSSGIAAGDFDNEFILKQNTKYLMRVTSGSAANLTNLALIWYEHTSGE